MSLWILNTATRWIIKTEISKGLFWLRQTIGNRHLWRQGQPGRGQGQPGRGRGQAEIPELLSPSEIPELLSSSEDELLAELPSSSEDEDGEDVKIVIKSLFYDDVLNGMDNVYIQIVTKSNICDKCRCNRCHWFQLQLLMKNDPKFLKPPSDLIYG